jgi:hypothetical protein
MTPLTDEQVNERIAKAKGWNFQLCGECNHEWWQMPDGGVDYNQSSIHLRLATSGGAVGRGQ